MTFKEIKKVLDEKGVKYKMKPEEEYGLVEFWTKTAGQHVPTEFDFDGTPEDFVEKFAARANDYNVDDEVKFFVNAGLCGQNGVPKTVKELLADCQEAKDTLMDIATALKNLNTPETAKKAGRSVPAVAATDMDLEYAKALWAEFGDVPIDNYDRITCSWRSFEKGTNRFVIWRWFEDFFELSIEDDLNTP